MNPIGFKSCAIRVYVFEERMLQLQHVTLVEDMIMALCPWKERVLAGVGCNLRGYEIGMKKMLKKAEIKNIESPIRTIHVSKGRVFTSEVADSFHIYKYQDKEQTFVEIADDILPRWSVATALLDHHTMAGADKF